MNALRKLADHGQSYWLDDLSRNLIRGGKLARLVADDGLRGITSNPAIFGRAIATGGDYDDQLRECVRAGQSTQQIYESLTTTDVRDACDVLLPVYRSTDGADGFVSLEVSPRLAHDAEGSIAEARHLAARVDRPNLMIKIPGTEAGLAAIEELLFEGINVNITLLFAVERYQAVAQRWMRALERRRSAGTPIHGVASVASFFVSRIDTLVDELISRRLRSDGTSPFEPNPAALQGKIAIANAKVAYAAYRRMAASDRWKALTADGGARPQRLLWASTSTKNPDYEDVMYVNSLIGPDTVNTMPAGTAAAFAAHGKLSRSLVRAVPDGRQALRALRAAGIDLRRVTWQLENEGIQKFIEPYDALLANIESRKAALAA